jgi:DNA end-binding protein Ku
LSFGLVNVPVGLYTAVEDRTVHFNQFHKGTANRIRYKKIDEQTGEEVQAADIVNGFDLGGGEYVIVTKEELKSAAPGHSDAIEIVDFVDLGAIDPIYFRQTYYLAPRGKGADRAYALLREAMASTGKVGVATLVLRDKEHLVAVRPGEDVLMLETMYFADEIRNPREALETLPEPAAGAPRELEIAKQLVESLTAPWSPSRYHNTYRARVEALVEEKRAGHAITVEPERPKSNVIDLMAALEASVAKAGARSEEAGSVDRVAATPAATSAAKVPRKAAAPSPASVQQRFDGMSKAELLERASAMDLQGRSKMSKLELVRALTEAETEPEAPKRKRRQAS